MFDFLGMFDQFHEAQAHFIGQIGESAFSQYAQQHLSNDYYIFNNIVLKANNGTTQIDQIILSKFGLFVVEIKSYKGWIWGDANNAQWTQTLPSGKYKFQNPLRQNYKHIKTLQSILGCPESHLKSLIVFSAHSEFRTELPNNVVRGGIDYINFIKQYQSVLLSDKEVTLIIEKILSNRLSNEEHQAHIQKIKEQYNNADENNAPQCPRCAKTMVLRKSNSANNYGQTFWGCSQYPNCKAIINIKGDKEKAEEAARQVNRLINSLLRF
jgi:hypothetical protein